MTFAEKRRRVDTVSECKFFLRDANLGEEMLLFGRDSSGGSVCVRIPTERTVYLPLPSPRASGAAPPPPPALAGLSSCKMTTLERAFPQQGEGGMREWQVVTYRSPGTQLVASAPSLLSSDTPVSAFLIARGIKCVRWLTTVGAQLVPRELQRSHCHAEYTAVDVVESNIDSDAAPPIVVLRVEGGGARIEQIDSVRGKVLSATANGDLDALVAEHDPDVVHGSIEQQADEAPILRYRTHNKKIRRANLDVGEDVWKTSLFAQVCGCPLGTAVRGISESCEFALLHAMLELGYVPVLPKSGSQAKVAVGGGLNFATVPGIHRNVLHFDFRSLYPSLVLEKNVDLCINMHQPLLPALMRRLVDSRGQAPTAAHAASFKECANKLIGCLAMSGSRLYCPAAYDRITGLGRTALNRANALVRKDRLGSVIAAQTDSLILVPTGEPGVAERLLARVNADYKHVQLAVKGTWSTVFMSAMKNRYAALDGEGLLTTCGLINKTQSAKAQDAIRSAVRQLLTTGGVAFDADTLALPSDQRNQVLSAIAELCGMAAAMDEADVRRKLDLHARAVQRVASLPLSGASTVASVPDHALRPGVAASDESPPPVVPIEDLFASHAPLCIAVSAGVIGDARADSVAPDAYPHIQHVYLALRACGLSHDASRGAIQDVSPGVKQLKRGDTVDGMEKWPAKEFAADVQRRGGDERGASCFWSCAASNHCPYKQGSSVATRRSLLAQRGVVGDAADEIEQLVAQGDFEGACGREFAARRGRPLAGGKPGHAALYVQQSHAPAAMA
jgi:hypothetical protein